MNYYTNYQLSFCKREKSESNEELTFKILAEQLNTSTQVNEDELEHGFNCKWYTHEQDMCKISELYPTHLFILYGFGEDKEDIWVKYFVNGKMQASKAILTYDRFDKSKLV